MPFTLEQINFLGINLGVAFPPEFTERKQREEKFKQRAAELSGRAEEIKQRHDGAQLEELLKQALGTGNDAKDFARALELLDQLEIGLNAPDLPPPPVEPPPPPPREEQAKETEEEQPEAISPKTEAPAEQSNPPTVSAKMKRRLEAADKEFVKRRLAEIQQPYEAAMKTKSPAARKLKEYYDAALKAEKAGNWTLAIDFIGRIQGMLLAVAGEEQQEAAQHGQSKRLGDTLGKVKATTFPVGAAEQFKKERLKPGKEFEKFLTALAKFEKAKTRANLEAMEKAAHAYLDHLEEVPAKDQEKSERPRKKQIVLAQLKAARHWKLADDYESLDDPPWDFEQQNKAGGIYARMLFEESDEPGRPLGSEGGVTAAWWVDEVSSFDYDKGKDEVTKNQNKKMIFKSMDGESSELPGFEPGMSAPREIIAKVLNDEIRSMTGVDTGVCPTFLVSMDNSRLTGPEGKPDATKPKQRVGSVQQLAENDGQMGARIKADGNRDRLDKIPKKNVDDMFMLDMMTLNLDRHANNFLMKDNPDGSSNLVPIDHGFCFPTPDSAKLLRSRLGPPQNSLMELPQAKEPFSPEALQAIDMLDPDAIAAKMKAAAKSMGETTPEAKGKISDESIELSRRSGLLLKRGARELTPAELNAALRISLDELIDAPANKLNEVIENIVQKAKKRRADTEDCKNLIAFPADAKTLDMYCSNLAALGWEIAIKKDFPAIFESQPDRFVRILRGRIVHPEAKKRLDARLKLLGDTVVLPPDFDGLPVKARLQFLDGELRKLGKKAPADDDRDEPPVELAAPAKKKLIAKYSKELPKLAAYFTSFRDDERLEKPDEEADRLASAIGWYELFLKEGGLEEAVRLNVGLGIPVDAAVSDLRTAKKLEAALKSTDKVSDQDARQNQTAFVQQLVQECSTGLGKLIAPATKQDLTQQFAVASNAAQNGDPDTAQKILEPMARQLHTILADEVRKTEAARKEWEKFAELLKKAPDNPAVQQFKVTYATELQGIEPLIAQGEFVKISQQTRTLTNELDRAAQGADSQIAKLEKLHTEALDLVKAIQSQNAVVTATKLAQEYKDAGELDSFWGQITALQACAGEEALAEVRKVLGEKKQLLDSQGKANKKSPKPTVSQERYESFYKKYNAYLDSGLSARLKSKAVVISQLLADIPTMLNEAKQI